jgi:hypothetical protein
MNHRRYTVLKRRTGTRATRAMPRAGHLGASPPALLRLAWRLWPMQGPQSEESDLAKPAIETSQAQPTTMIIRLGESVSRSG